MPSAIFDPTRWTAVPGFAFTDLTYHRAVGQGTVRIAFNRPEVRNAFRPRTVDELYAALDHARQTSDVGTVLLTGNGPSPKDGGWAFCSGGDQRIRGKAGYQYQEGDGAVDAARLGRLHILEVQRLIRFMPKVVIAVVNGWAVGGGHSLARRVRPDAGQRRAREVQADRRRRRQLRRRLRLGVPGADGRAEEGPRDLLPRPHLLRAKTRPTWAWPTRSSPTPTSSGSR
jgi:1,4-dihydroxy-2-naphthoyl-CoA synthase